MATKIRFGILGVSRVAQKNVLPALAVSPLAETLMRGSRDTGKARACAETFSVDSFGSYDEVLANPDIDAVYISLPNSLHEEWSVRAAEAGKHVWCEKPAALSFAAARRMASVAASNNVRIIEGFAFLYHPQHAHVLSLLGEETLGEIKSFEGSFMYPMPESQNIRLSPALGGGSYSDAAVYPIRASRMIFREEPLAISCNLTIDPATGVDAKVDICVEYPNERIAKITSGFSDEYQSTYAVTGSKATLSLERAYAVPPDMAVCLHLTNVDASKREILIPAANQFALLLDDFCTQIALGTKSTKRYEEDIVLQARIFEAGLLSNTEQRSVRLSELPD